MSRSKPRPRARAGSPRVCLTTAPGTRAAMDLARALVLARAAACVNVVPRVRSVYRWKGAVRASDEALLVVKTTAGRARDLERRIRELHPYEVPELVWLAPRSVERRYLAWLRASTSGPRGGRR